MSLKVVKLTQKCIEIFQIFGDKPRLAGDKPWSKNGDKCRMGGIGKNFAGWGGGPQSTLTPNKNFPVRSLWGTLCPPPVTPLSFSLALLYSVVSITAKIKEKLSGGAYLTSYQILYDTDGMDT